MGDRITIVLDSGNVEKLRSIQANMIRTSTKSISFSRVLNLVVSEGLKKFKTQCETKHYSRITIISNWIKSDQKNPLHPIDIDDYSKLFDYVLTAQGLVYFQTLKRKSILGQEMVLDEYNKLRLLYVYYATTNRNPKEVYAWQDICMTLDSRGIFEKNMYQSKEDLKSKLLIVNNPQYQPGIYRQHIDYVKENFNSK